MTNRKRHLLSIAFILVLAVAMAATRLLIGPAPEQPSVTIETEGWVTASQVTIETEGWTTGLPQEVKHYVEVVVKATPDWNK